MRVWCVSGVWSVSGMWRESESVECGVSESVEYELECGV